MSRSTLSDFVRLQPLGRGSFGTVYKARRKEDGLHYVLKHVPLASLPPLEQQRAVEEVRILARFDSPLVVRYYDAFVEAGELVIVMEYCAGGDLSQWMRARKGRPPAEDEVWRVLVQALCGLWQLHRTKVLHRDLKAANLFLDASGAVKIGDLGVAKALGASKDFARTTVGTPYYLCPELCGGRPYGERADVWSLGVVAYELCTGGRRPFEARSAGELVLKIMNATPPPLPTRLSPQLRRLVRSMLTKDARRRPTTARLLASAPVRARAAALGLGELLPPPAPRAAARPRTAAPRPPRPPRRKPRPASAQRTKPTVGEFLDLLREEALQERTRDGPHTVRARKGAAALLGLEEREEVAGEEVEGIRATPTPVTVGMVLHRVEEGSGAQAAEEEEEEPVQWSVVSVDAAEQKAARARLEHLEQLVLHARAVCEKGCGGPDRLEAALGVLRREEADDVAVEGAAPDPSVLTPLFRLVYLEDEARKARAALRQP